MDFENYLKISAEEINQELGKLFQKWSEKVKAISPKLVELNNAFIQANEGGKRLRGALVKLGYELAGGKNVKEILKPAVAFEIFQTAILAHDDIIDRADIRRGKPTIYQALGGDHRAVAHTICLGDIGFFLAVQLIVDSNFKTKNKNKALSLFTKMFISTGLGEMLDTELPYLQAIRKEKDVLNIHRLKTACYTTIYPLCVGASLGGGNEELFGWIEKFGEPLGVAFQIQDDILGIFGDEKTLGKLLGSDIEEGKNTLLIIQALKNASAEQNEILNKYYGKGKIGVGELEQIKKVFKDTGALEYSQKKAEALVKESKEIIPQLTINREQRTILSEMADFLVARDK